MLNIFLIYKVIKNTSIILLFQYEINGMLFIFFSSFEKKTHIFMSLKNIKPEMCILEERRKNKKTLLNEI